MQVFQVRHLTRYRYAKPVRFGEHRMMLRPRDDADQRLLAQRLAISPDPDALEVSRDAHGNWVATARFSDPAPELSFVSELEVARAPAGRFEPDPLSRPRAPLSGADPMVTLWARRALERAGWNGREPPDTQAMAMLCRAIHEGLRYRRRLESGIQSPGRTLELGSGACRDFAMLMIVAARGFGLPARFASGYAHNDGAFADGEDGPKGGHTHAWAQVLTPDQGWIDFDPTSGLAGPDGLIRVAVAEDPGDAAPISGVWFGRQDDFLGMDVEVQVRPSEGAEPTAALAGEPSPPPGVA
jgi:transglutaminase-like putative cysteine protease